MSDTRLAANLQVVLISGQSGAGKSVALAVLEDAGYYCLDNLPAPFVPQIAGYLAAQGSHKLAISVDARSSESLARLPVFIKELRSGGADVRVLFLESRQDILVKRFSETRRKHPLSGDNRTVAECIQIERDLLADLVIYAQRIDTSDMRPNALRTWVKSLVEAERAQLSLVFQSFGFKHGIPLDADLVFDARALPNPHYDPLLRPLTGRDAPVIAYLEGNPPVLDFLGDIVHLVERWLPGYLADNRSYLTVAVGCTGGQHRSVYLVEQLAAHFQASQRVLIRHRELSGAL